LQQVKTIVLFLQIINKNDQMLNWEKWNFKVIYFPLAFVWVWYIIKSRAIWFFTPSNPTIDFGGFQGEGKKITYHDSCYLGRANNIYEAPRKVLEALDVELVEMKRCKTNGLCCGAGGAQMFKEEEKGSSRVNLERTNDILNSNANIVAAACPFCNTMLSDGIKVNEKESDILVLDIAELVAESMN
jgi:Fe-S oxidoreductase